MLHHGSIEIRPDERKVLHEGREVVLGGRAFDLLLVLIECRERVVSKVELMERVWPDLVVEENNLHVQIAALRRALGPGLITTIPGRGYRFTPPYALATGGAGDAHETAPATVPSAPGPPWLSQTEALLGREIDCVALAARLQQQRLISVVGAGGIGKTRLVREVARRCQMDFADGVWWVDLASLKDDGEVCRVVAAGLGIRSGDGDAAMQLAQALHDRGRLLLVLDNCEQVAAGVGALTAVLLTALPHLQVLATSLVPLHIDGEQVWRLGSLGLPARGVPLEEARQCGAFALFEQRACQVDQRFVILPGQLELVIDLCRHLDGNALAIEMAAVRAPQIGIEALHARLTDRLRLLRSINRQQPERHHSLRALLDWSCALLDEVQRGVLWRLAVFGGSFRLDLALQVLVDDELDEWTVLDALGVLVDRSLLQIESVDPPCYRLPESTQVYAHEQLSRCGLLDLMRTRHVRLAEWSG